MIKRILLAVFVLSFAFLILFISILRTASIKYNLNSNGKAMPTEYLNIDNVVQVDYILPNPGRVLTDSPFWLLKAMRDKSWLIVTTDGGKKADLLLHLADKRLMTSKVLFEKGNWQLGYSTLTKGEKYLLKAIEQENMNRQGGMDTNQFLLRISLASLKHAEMMRSFVVYSPEELKPKFIELENSPRKVYEESRNALLSKNINPPTNVFDWR